MNSELKTYKVKIFNEEYSLVTDESEEHVIDSANHLHVLLQEAYQKCSLGSEKKVTVLVALRLVSELAHLKCSLKKMTDKSVEFNHRIERLIGSINEIK